MRNRYGTLSVCKKKHIPINNLCFCNLSGGARRFIFGILLSLLARNYSSRCICCEILLLCRFIFNFHLSISSNLLTTSICSLLFAIYFEGLELRNRLWSFLSFFAEIISLIIRTLFICCAEAKKTINTINKHVRKRRRYLCVCVRA